MALTVEEAGNSPIPTSVEDIQRWVTAFQDQAKRSAILELREIADLMHPAPEASREELVQLFDPVRET